MDKIALNEAENGGILMLPEESLCPGEFGSAFVFSKKRNEEGAHQHIEHLIAVDAMLAEFQCDLRNDIKDFAIAESIKVKVRGTLFALSICLLTQSDIG